VVTAGPARMTEAVLARITPTHRVAWIVKDDPAFFPAPLCRALSARADLVFCNAAERHLLLHDGVTPIRPQQVIETRGADGLVVDRESGRTSIAASSVAVRDATGAGDTLAGSVLAQMLAGCADLAHAAAQAMDEVRSMLLERDANAEPSPPVR